MKLLCSVLILASALSASVQAMPSSSSIVQARLQTALNQYLTQTRDFDAALNEDMSAQCFALYLPMLNEVAATFSNQYQACITVANEEIANLTAQAAKNQELYKQEVSDLCTAFTTCDSDNDTVSFFNCYASAAQSDVSVIYDISTNAASTANTLSVGIKAIQDTEYTCTNSTETDYVRDTATTYDLLDNCLKNGVPTSSTASDDTSATTDGVSPSSDASSSVDTSTDDDASKSTTVTSV